MLQACRTFACMHLRPGLPIFQIMGFLLCSMVLSAQSSNTILRSNWDDDALISQGGVTFNDLWGYADGNGREYAIMGSRLFTHFIDVTDPDKPVEVAREPGGNNCLWRDYKVFGHYAYGVSDGCNEGLEVYDLSALPDSVTKVYDSQEFIVDAHNVFIDEVAGRLYACGISAGTADIVILDLNNSPESPGLIKNLILPDGYVHDLYVRNDTAYCAHIYRHKLIIYDFSDLEDIVGIGQLSSDRFNHSNWVSQNGDILVIADESFNRPVIVADISDIESPTQIATFKSTLLGPFQTNSIAHNPFIVGNDFVVLSYYDDGLQIFNIDDPTSPFQAGYYDTDTTGMTYSADGAWGAYPYLPSGNLLASDMENGLFVVTPAFPLLDCTTNVSLTGNYDNAWEIISKDFFETSASFDSSSNIDVYAPAGASILNDFSIEEGGVLAIRLEDRCTSMRGTK